MSSHHLPSTPLSSRVLVLAACAWYASAGRRTANRADTAGSSGQRATGAAGQGRQRQRRRLWQCAAAANPGLDPGHHAGADAESRDPPSHRRDEVRRQRQRRLQRGRLCRAVFDPRFRARQYVQLSQGRAGDFRRRRHPVGKQGTDRSAERPGRAAGRRRDAGRHRQLRHQAPNRDRSALAHAGSTRARHALRRARSRRPLRRPALRLPHQRRRRKTALVYPGRRRRTAIPVRRLRLAHQPAGAAAVGPRLPAQGATDGARLPVDSTASACQPGSIPPPC